MLFFKLFTSERKICLFFYRPPMKWTSEHEELLLREIFTYEPFNFKSGSFPRGECWKLIADSLNAIDKPKFTVSHRSVREKYLSLEKEYKQKIRQEEKATGIAPKEPTEIEKALEEIISKFEDIELKEKESANNKAQKEREK